jgi:predicted metal-dependent RNase
MVRFLAHANVGVHAIRQIGVTNIIDITAMATTPTTIVGANIVHLHIGQTLLNLGWGMDLKTMPLMDKRV